MIDPFPVSAARDTPSRMAVHPHVIRQRRVASRSSSTSSSTSSTSFSQRPPYLMGDNMQSARAASGAALLPPPGLGFVNPTRSTSVRLAMPETNRSRAQTSNASAVRPRTPLSSTDRLLATDPGEQAESAATVGQTENGEAWSVSREELRRTIADVTAFLQSDEIALSHPPPLPWRRQSPRSNAQEFGQKARYDVAYHIVNNYFECKEESTRMGSYLRFFERIEGSPSDVHVLFRMPAPLGLCEQRFLPDDPADDSLCVSDVLAPRMTLRRFVEQVVHASVRPVRVRLFGRDNTPFELRIVKPFDPNEQFLGTQIVEASDLVCATLEQLVKDSPPLYPYVSSVADVWLAPLCLLYQKLERQFVGLDGIN